MIYLFTSLLFFFLNILCWLLFDPFSLIFQKNITLYIFNTYYNFGIDGISLFFIYLTSFLLPLCILFSWNSKNKYRNDFIKTLFCIEILLFFIFTVMDLLLFYIFFEIILIPFFVYIGINGYKLRRIHAAYLFFFYTLFGSLLMLIAIILMYLHCGTTNIYILWNADFSIIRESLIWIGFFISFGIKIPIFPFHIWLPEAHVEAPTEGSVILAGILLKLGAYGFFRFIFPLFPLSTYYFSPIVITLSSLAVLYCSLTTLRQNDIKKIIAYSSIAHMNMAILGFFLLDITSISGSFLMMVGHGIVSAGLFFIVGILYDRYKTKLIQYYSGIVQCMPLFTIFFFLFTLGNISLPLTANFLSELLIICGFCIKYNISLIVISVIGIFIGTMYSMWMFNRISFGIPYYYLYNYIKDISFIEFIIIMPLVFHMFWIGIYPIPFLNIFNYSLNFIMFNYL